MTLTSWSPRNCSCTPRWTTTRITRLKSMRTSRLCLSCRTTYKSSRGMCRTGRTSSGHRTPGSGNSRTTCSLRTVRKTRCHRRWGTNWTNSKTWRTDTKTSNPTWDNWGTSRSSANNSTTKSWSTWAISKPSIGNPRTMTESLPNRRLRIRSLLRKSPPFLQK